MHSKKSQEKLTFIHTVPDQPIAVYWNQQLMEKNLCFQEMMELPCEKEMADLVITCGKNGHVLHHAKQEWDPDTIYLFSKKNGHYTMVPVKESMDRTPKEEKTWIKRAIDKFNRSIQLTVNRLGVVVKDVKTTSGEVVVKAGSKLVTLIDKSNQIFQVIVNQSGEIVAVIIEGSGEVLNSSASRIGNIIRRVVDQFGNFVNVVIHEVEGIVGWVVDGVGSMMGVSNEETTDERSIPPLRPLSPDQVKQTRNQVLEVDLPDEVEFHIG